MAACAALLAACIVGCGCEGSSGKEVMDTRSSGRVADQDGPLSYILLIQQFRMAHGRRPGTTKVEGEDADTILLRRMMSAISLVSKGQLTSRRAAVVDAGAATRRHDSSEVALRTSFRDPTLLR